MYRKTNHLMKKFLFIPLCALVLTACHESLEEKAAREAEEFTRKNCPMKISEYIVNDSMAYEKDTRTIHYYYTIKGRADTTAIYTPKIKEELIKGVKDAMSLNLEKKRSLCEQAEALKESTDWRATSEKLTQLQKEWRTIGAVPRKYSDAIWKRFTEACDYFFDRKKQEFASKKNEEQENLQAKQAIIEKLNAIDETLDKNAGLTQVRALMSEWAAIGHVPFKEKDKLRKQYQTALDVHFKRWNMKEARNRLDAFSNTVEELASSEQAQNKLYRERERLMRAYESMKNSLQTYQNNMGFLNVSSKSGNKMVEELKRKIDKLKDDMQLLVQKIELIDEKLR